MTPATLEALAARVEAASGFDNSLDVQCELALFEADDFELAIRPNAAGSKVIVTCLGEVDRTFIARDYTISAAARKNTAAALRARAATLSQDTDHD